MITRINLSDMTDRQK